ncbi:hypothetical protein DRH29_02115 [candidate division Kazan bacterium]|uniref:Ribosome-binding factor A n=1 Tax=candidate division Kazan bacterium TaxID=2202143 RepID=A0A420ZCY7_UNCK3|nr:MAG: hypothetical protein DRH29_02115 [candidate division Kazan bacterium]
MVNHLRKSKLEALLQSAIAQYFLERQQSWGISATALVDEVIVSPDLKSAKVWLSFSPGDINEENIQFKKVAKHIHELQQFLFKRMRIRKVPRITLLQSNTEQQFKLERIFDTLKSHDGDENQTDTDRIEKDSSGSAP